MPEILYDHQKFSAQQYGGISRYFAGLIAGVSIKPGYKVNTGVLYHMNQHLDTYSILDNAFGRMLFKSKPSRISKWNKQYSRHLIRKGTFDLLHPTYYDPYFIKGLKKPYVLTVHDMIYELLPEHFLPGEQLPLQKRITIEHASGLIAISQSAKKDLMQVLGTPGERIRVIHHGIDFLFQVEPLASLPKDYLLFVGERANYKNFDSFLVCFVSLQKLYPDLQLICVGGGIFNDAEITLQKQLGISGCCRQLMVSDAQLNYIYQQALVFVFPSLYEGFGYPLLEAFRAGCAVAASNTSSFTEVGGDAVHYFNPADEQSIHKAISDLLSNTDLRKDYIEKGYRRLTCFPLQKEIDETLSYYQQIINQS